MKWQGYLETNMGYELVKDDFPERFNRDDVISAFEVMHNSEKSIFFTISLYLLFSFILRFASRLEPMSFELLFSSMLTLLKFLILINSSHFLFKLKF